MRLSAHARIVAVSMAVGLAASPCSVVAQTLAPATVVPNEPSSSAVTFSPSFRSIFAETLTDFRRLPSLQTAAILSIGGVGSAIGHRADRNLTRALSSSQDLHGFFGAGQTIGGAPMQMAGAFAAYTVGRAANKPRVASALSPAAAPGGAGVDFTWLGKK